jgi:polyisoprenoid-binding protein YceI
MLAKLTIFAMVMANAMAAGAQTTNTMPLTVQPGSSVWVDGRSNVHDWSCRASTFEAHIDVDSESTARIETVLATETIQRVTVRLAVRHLKCGNSKMETDLCRALKADDASVSSDIVGVFIAVRAETQPTTLHTEGTITVAGVAKDVRVRIAIEHLADGTLKARGNVPLLMTDFGVTPPTALLGLVRSHNEVVVKFELIIANTFGGIAAKP